MIRKVAKLVVYRYIPMGGDSIRRPVGTMNKVNLERELIRGFLDGNRTAYETIDSWIMAVLHLRSWHGSIRASRDDIRQEVLTALLENFRQNRYKGKGLKTYVSSITKFTCLKAYDRTVSVVASEDDAQDERPSVLDDLVRHEELSAIRSATKLLTLKCRKMLALRFYDNKSHSEIASALGITVEASRQWLKRCLDTLRDLTNRPSEV